MKDESDVELTFSHSLAMAMGAMLFLYLASCWAAGIVWVPRLSIIAMVAGIGGTFIAFIMFLITKRSLHLLITPLIALTMGVVLIPTVMGFWLTLLVQPENVSTEIAKFMTIGGYLSGLVSATALILTVNAYFSVSTLKR